MNIEFDRMETSHSFAGVDRWLTVRIDGQWAGECYREAGMDEWAVDAALEERFGANLATGHANAAQFKAALRREILAKERGE